MDEDEEAVSENSFRSKSVWRRMAVIAAGAIMNLILGFLISIVTLLVAQQYTTNIVAEISDGSGCQAAGMQVGDRIVKVNGLHIFTANDIIYQLRNDEDGVLDFVVVRDGRKLDLNGVKFQLTVDEETGERVLNYDSRYMPRSLEQLIFFLRRETSSVTIHALCSFH